MLLLLFRNSLQLLLISQKLSECEAIKVQAFLNISIFFSLSKFCPMGVLNIDWHGISAKRAGFFRPGWKTDFIEINKIFYPKLGNLFSISPSQACMIVFKLIPL